MGLKVRANPRFQLMDSNGEPASGWKIYTYESGTVTPKATYNGYGGSANANPVVLNARGEADIWWNGTYTVVVKDANDVTIYSVDDYGQGEELVAERNFNLVLNGGFETDTDADSLPDNWTITAYSNVSYGAGTVAIDAVDQYQGINSLKFTSLGDGGGYAISDLFAVTEGDILAVEWMMKSSAAGVRNTVDILWYTYAEVSVSTSSIYDDSTTNPTSWTRKDGVVTVPSTARYAKLKITGCHSSDTTSGNTRFDDMKVYVASFNANMTFAGDNTFSGADSHTGREDFAVITMAPPVTGGSTTAYTATLGLTAYTTNRVYECRINATNTTASTTINFDSLGAKTIKLLNGNDAYIGALKGIARFWYDGTNMVLLNPEKVFRGCLVYRSSAQTISTGSTTEVLFDAEEFDTDGIHSTSSNTGRLTVPTGVTKVRLSFRTAFAANTTGSRTFSVYKNGSAVNYFTGKHTETVTPTSSGAAAYVLNVPPITVVAGDYFSLHVTQDSGGDLDLPATTILTYGSMEIIE